MGLNSYNELTAVRRMQIVNLGLNLLQLPVLICYDGFMVINNFLFLKVWNLKNDNDPMCFFPIKLFFEFLE